LNALLVAVNSSYIQTNLAVRSISAYSGGFFGQPLPYIELTVNQRPAELLWEIAGREADCYLFSCYIWNIGLIVQLVADLKKLKPSAVVILGGPEADWQPETLLASVPEIDYILCGEGERSACLLLEALEHGGDPSTLPGIAYRANSVACATKTAPLPELADLPFPYPDLAPLRGRLLYYESMRGCPYSCSYCLSSREKQVRFRPLELVFQEMLYFLAARVPQVKFVDRTFNCDPARAMKLWRFLSGHDNGVTNFHFELAGDLLSGDMLGFLAGVRPGLFQFEIGVQSTNPETLSAIQRGCDFSLLSERVARLREAGNIHIHLDLIAGLPYEGLGRFARSFDDVIRLRPHQLQLGFLKLLGGSKLREDAAAYGIVAEKHAPYEALKTRWLSYRELHLLHGVAAMVERYYNSGRFTHIIAYLMSCFESPFTFFRLLYEYYDSVQGGSPLSKTGYYELLGGFMGRHSIAVTEKARWLCRYDLLLHERPRKMPEWIGGEAPGPKREWLNRARKEAGAGCYLEVFPFLPPDGAPGEQLLTFDYGNRDFTGRATVRFRGI
jgi:radical SAM superfamily enzyme YgiQ (UPF0313 family)